MCEHCSKTEVSISKIDSEEELLCEWFTEEKRPGGCHETAVYSVAEWVVEDHLCEVHKQQTEKEHQEGLGDFLESVGFGSQYEMRPINEDGTCDYIPPAEINNWQPCGKKATYAKYTLEEWLVCPEHAAAMGYDAQEE